MSSAVTIKQRKFSVLYGHYYTFLSEKLEVTNVIWRTDYSVKEIYQCAKIAESLQLNIRPLFSLSLLCFYSKVWMYLICQQQQTWEQITRFLLSQHIFLSIRETRKQWQILNSILTISDKNWHSVNLFCFKTYTRGVFRTQLNVCNKACLWFS